MQFNSSPKRSIRYLYRIAVKYPGLELQMRHIFEYGYRTYNIRYLCRVAVKYSAVELGGYTPLPPSFAATWHRYFPATHSSEYYLHLRLDTEIQICDTSKFGDLCRSKDNFARADKQCNIMLRPFAHINKMSSRRPWRAQISEGRTSECTRGKHTIYDIRVVSQ